MVKQSLVAAKRVCAASLCAVSMCGVVAGSASAAESAAGSVTCPSGQQVSIESSGMGFVVHSYSAGPEHLGYPVYRQNWYNLLFVRRYTKTSLRSISWQVRASDHLDKRLTWADCERP